MKQTCNVKPGICPFEGIPSSGNLAVYIGQKEEDSSYQQRYLNLPIFVSLLKQAEENMGFSPTAGLELDEFLNLFSDSVDPNYCREGTKDFGFTPLLPKTRA
ncbi:hypothetical protein MKW92_042474 [Papaver armeniacum]|nr:hypothetical protein MKW92_042474 [Papaver armeniacum]